MEKHETKAKKTNKQYKQQNNQQTKKISGITRSHVSCVF